MKKYDLEDRTLAFAKEVIRLVNKVSKTLPNVEIARQLVHSSGSVGANYIEANESLGEKDFAMQIKICRKEAKESRYWLQLLDNTPDLSDSKTQLIQESTELMKIFGAILVKIKQRQQPIE
ncbi:MAG: four helix bundle protein [Bacteroidota bacterium]